MHTGRVMRAGAGAGLPAAAEALDAGALACGCVLSTQCARVMGVGWGHAQPEGLATGCCDDAG